VAFTLAQQRHRLRRDLDRPHDTQDDLADQLLDAHGTPDRDGRGSEWTAVLFWPRAEFDRLLERWPMLAESYGPDGDEHRTTLQRGLVLWSEAGRTGHWRCSPGASTSWRTIATSRRSHCCPFIVGSQSQVGLDLVCQHGMTPAMCDVLGAVPVAQLGVIELLEQLDDVAPG
jgi:hypothetical protein